MKLIPSYQEFVDDMSLTGKISPELAESLASDFEEIDSLNEGFLDSIKNTLSKTFLGSLSYINMIDKVRESILKDQKDLLTKRYSHLDEIDSLNTSLKQAQKSKDSVNADRIGKTISNKENEYKTYVNMLNKRIERAEDAISKIIEGNKRRSEYYDAGKSQDELTLAEFEYKLAKARTNADPQEIKDLEIKVKDAKEEAEEAKIEIEKSAKDKAEKEKAARGKKEKNSEKSEDESGEESLSKQIEKTEKAIKKVKNEIAALKHKQIDLERRGKELSREEQMELESKNTFKSELEKLLNDTRFSNAGVNKKEDSSDKSAEELKKKSEEIISKINSVGK